MSFEYNDEGIRTSKTVNGVTTTYYVNGGQIVAEKTDTRTIVYIYDAPGTPIGMMYRTTSYAEGTFDVFWFEKNLQGDIIAIYNNAGTKLATYTYTDAWGNYTVSYSNGGASTGAQYNPFRYRGYYYDTDLGMYYLQSRYYDAKICRFISDDYASVTTATPYALTDKNLYAYCDNNPVMRVDGDGMFWSAVLLGGVIGVAFEYLSDVIDNFNSGKTGEDIFIPTSSLNEYIAAFVGGAIAATPVKGLCSTLVVGAMGSIASDMINGNLNCIQDVLNSGIKGATANAVGYGVGKLFAKIKANKIASMSREVRKNYLTDNVYKNSRSFGNANLHTFADNPVGTVELTFKVFKYGIYSSISSKLFEKAVFS